MKNYLSLFFLNIIRGGIVFAGCKIQKSLFPVPCPGCQMRACLANHGFAAHRETETRGGDRREGGRRPRGFFWERTIGFPRAQTNVLLSRECHPIRGETSDEKEQKAMGGWQHLCYHPHTSFNILTQVHGRRIHCSLPREKYNHVRTNI